jgi:AGZA family xanthine/uracil permease-like MFS transporter
MDKYFGIRERGSTIPREIIGGLVTFMAVVYILAVHPGIMTAAGMDPGKVFTATAISAGLVTILMGVFAKLPIALAPGLGINAFIAFSVCGPMGFSWQTAIAAVFIEGLIFIAISLCGIRERIIDAIPDQLKKAVALGIGLFIAVVGLSGAGIVRTDLGTTVGFAPITSGAPLVAIIGLAIIIVLYALRVPGAIFIGIVGATIVGIPLGVTTLPASVLSAPPAPYNPADIVSGLAAVRVSDFLVVLFSLLFIDLFDTVSTLFAVAQQGNLLDGDGRVVNVKQALLSDAIGTSFGALLGATTVTSYIESSTGVSAGARTGLASVVTGFLLLLALVLSPVFLAIPGAATAPALIFVGFLMLGAISNIDLRNVETGLPIFITMIAIPFSYSISMGLAWGFVTYTLVKVCVGKTRDLTVATWVLTALFLAKMIIG